MSKSWLSIDNACYKGALYQCACILTEMIATMMTVMITVAVTMLLLFLLLLLLLLIKLLLLLVMVIIRTVNPSVLTCSTVCPVMNPKANSPFLGCLISTHSWKAFAASFSGFKAALTCRGQVRYAK
jgi:hypothetical protein